MENKKRIENLYRKFVDNTISKRELKTLWDYLAKANDDELSPLKDLLRSKLADQWPKTSENIDRKSKLREKLQARMDNDSPVVDPQVNLLKETDPVKRPKKSYTFFKVAAVLTLAVLTSLSIYFFQPQLDPAPTTKVYQTTHRQKSRIVLPDRSVVHLNSGSILTYPEKFDENSREVILEGEAFFEVTRNPAVPFIVKSGQLETRVLGTSFNIKAYPGEQNVQVAVATGKVAVTQKSNNDSGQEPLILVPNEIASYDASKGSLTKTISDVTDMMAWKDGIMVLEDKNFAEVGKILERWYGTKVIFDNPQLRNCRVRGRFNNPSNLQQVLEALQFVHDIQYELRADSVVIRGEGCARKI